MLERWKPHLVKWRGGWQVAWARSEDNRTITDNRVWEVENTRKETGEVIQSDSDVKCLSDRDWKLLRIKLNVCVYRVQEGENEDTKRWRPERRWKMKTFTAILLRLLSAGHRGFLRNQRAVGLAEICPRRAVQSSDRDTKMMCFHSQMKRVTM